MTKELSKLEQQIQKFMPFNEQEEHDKAILLKWFESGSDILTRENETTLKYSLPAAIVSGLFVKILMIVVGMKNEIMKNIKELISDIRSARPRIFSTVFLSPFPQYWAHNTEVPVAIP